MRRRRKGKSRTRFLNSPEPLSEEHLLRIAHQAVAKAKVPPEIMPYEDCLEMALDGIVRGYAKFNRDKEGDYDPFANWGSGIRPWLSMQAYFAIRDEARRIRRTLARNTPLEEPDLVADDLTPTPQEEVYQDEKAKMVETLLSHLQKRDRDIVIRICMRGETFIKVAKSYRMKWTDVQKRYKDAIFRLREIALSTPGFTESELFSENI